MNTEKLFNEIISLGVNANLTTLFDYATDRDRRFKFIQMFDEPNEEVVKLCLANGCKIKEGLLNKRDENGNFIKVVTYDVFPKNVSELEFV